MTWDVRRKRSKFMVFNVVWIVSMFSTTRMRRRKGWTERIRTTTLMCFNTKSTQYSFLSTPSILWVHWIQVYKRTISCACIRIPSLTSKLKTYTLFVSAIMFSRKWVIFQKVFSIKLSLFPIFGFNFKWVEIFFPNLPYLACCEIKFFKKI